MPIQPINLVEAYRIRREAEAIRRARVDELVRLAQNEVNRPEEPLENPIMPLNPVQPNPPPDVCPACTRTIANGDCECFACLSCGTRGDAGICSSCGRCEGRCCRCFVCNYCATRMIAGTNNVCRNCGRCTRCCTCERPQARVAERQKIRVIEFFPNKLIFHNASKKQFKKNPSHRHISVELEFSDAKRNAGLTDIINKWSGSVVKDGSLPHDTGFEINCSPATGDLFIEQVVELCKKLKDSEAIANEMCGYHVHVDAQDFRYHEIRRLIFLYSSIEDAIFNIVPTHRRNNKYCPKCAQNYLTQVKEGKDCKGSICEIVYGQSGPAAKNIKTHRNNKYWERRRSALNLHSWMYRGTVECRLAAGSANPNKIIPWAMLWAHIIDFVYKKTETDIRKLCSSFDGNGVLFEIARDAEKAKYPPIVTNFLKERIELFKRADADNADNALVYGEFPY